MSNIPIWVFVAGFVHIYFFFFFPVLAELETPKSKEAYVRRLIKCWLWEFTLIAWAIKSIIDYWKALPDTDEEYRKTLDEKP